MNRPTQKSVKTIATIANVNTKDVVNNVIKTLGGLESFVQKGDKVLIKPNICGGIRGKKGSFTNPQILASTIRLLKDTGASVTVGEADAYCRLDEGILTASGITQEGIEVTNLSKGDFVEVDVPKGVCLKRFTINKLVATADVIISMPVMKTHNRAVVSLGMKNMFGILPNKKMIYHPKLDQVIVDVCSVFPPNLTITDASTAMEGQGPFDGEPVELGLIIAGNNVVSTDAIAASIMGIDPASIGHLRHAFERGLGLLDTEKIEIIGNSIERVKRPFILAKIKN